jgi:hypothetical protein
MALQRWACAALGRSGLLATAALPSAPTAALVSRPLPATLGLSSPWRRALSTPSSSSGKGATPAKDDTKEESEASPGLQRARSLLRGAAPKDRRGGSRMSSSLHSLSGVAE